MSRGSSSLVGAVAAVARLLTETVLAVAFAIILVDLWRIFFGA